MFEHARFGGLALIASVGLVGTFGCSAQREAEEDEVLVAMGELPAAVRETLDREARGGTVEEIEWEIEGGRVVYSAEVMLDGREWEIEIGEDGSVVSKEMEEEAGEDDEDEHRGEG